MLRSGRQEGVPYSLSRYTDVSASGRKWDWFERSLKAGQMIAFDPRSAGAPSVWSLRPEDTLGLVFWTKNPSNLIAGQLRLEPYEVAIHMTITGWAEVEKGAPSIEDAGRLLIETGKAFSTVRWRFSPIPLLSDWVVLERFKILLGYAETAGVKSVFVSFLQTNDRIPETRTLQQRFDLLNAMAAEAESHGVEIALCKDDQSFVSLPSQRFSTEICVPGGDFPARPSEMPELERCGCVLMVDPFTTNESCSLGCSYCYAADVQLHPKSGIRPACRWCSVERSKEWWLQMARREGDSEVGVGGDFQTELDQDSEDFTSEEAASATACQSVDQVIALVSARKCSACGWLVTPSEHELRRRNLHMYWRIKLTCNQQHLQPTVVIRADWLTSGST